MYYHGMRIGYKGTWNLKSGYNLTYEVGKTYSIDSMKMCSHGFHFSETIENTFEFYDKCNEKLVVLKCEILGDVEQKDRKFITNKLKVLKVVDKSEYQNLVPKFEYDDNGNLIKKIDINGDVWGWEYDVNGNITKKVTPGGTWTYEYDYKGVLRKEIFPQGFVRIFDKKKRLIKRIDPRVGTWIYTYDDKGNQISEVGPKEKWKITIE